MLSTLVLIFCSVLAVLAKDVANLDDLNPIFSQNNYLPGYSFRRNDAEVLPTVTNEPQTPENCPANEVLQRIIVILSNYLSENDERNYLRENLQKESREDDADEDSSTRRVGNEKLIIPLSKIDSLKQLLESNVLPKKLKAKVSVRYELPSGEELSCKQALAKILQVLNEANLMRDYYRSCGPNDICPTDKVTDIKTSADNSLLNVAINQESNYKPNRLIALLNEQKSSNLNQAEPNKLLALLNEQNSFNLNQPVIAQSKGGIDNFIKYLLSLKNSDDILTVLKNHRSNEYINMFNNTVTKELLQKLGIQPESARDRINNTPVNKKILFDQLISPSIQTSNPNGNLSSTIAEVLLQESKLPENQNTKLNKRPDNLLLPTGNAANIISLIPSENPENIENDVLNSEKTIIKFGSMIPDKNNLVSDIEINKKQILKDTGENFPDTSLNDGPKNVSTDTLMPLMNTVQSDDDYGNLINSILQYQLQNQQSPSPKTSNDKSQGTQPYPNSNVVLNGGKYLLPYGFSGSPVYQLPNQISSAYSTYYTNNGNQYRFPNLNLPKTPNLLNNQNTVYQTSYLNSNPYTVNSNLINDMKQARQQQFYAPHLNNLANSQRPVGVTDQVKLVSAPDNKKIVELTYMLKRPNPVVYQPVYFVKYRLPYETFVNNLRELLAKRPQLRIDPAKLYRELLAVSNVSEVSPSLRGVGKQQLTQMVTSKGALVNTKVMKINETLLEKQLETIRNFNSILSPNEILNVTYTIKTNEQSDNSDKIKLPTLSDQNVINKLRDIIHRDLTLGNALNEVSTESPSTKASVDYEVPDISPLG